MSPPASHTAIYRYTPSRTLIMQSDKQAANKLAMSRALGAAFLSHQVEQLEKSVGRESRSATSTNWRERNGQVVSGRGGKRGGSSHAHGHQGGRKKERKEGERNEGGESSTIPESGESSVSTEQQKDADTIVVDASVLVHALGQLKKWCKDGRKEEVVIPLEALNTLDLLKKGSTPLAQRARAASRILESQVGTNPRIRVQRDDAFVLWDEVPIGNPPSDESSRTVDNGINPETITLLPPPEWLRRTICCSRWEVVNAVSGSTSPDAPILLESPNPLLSRSSSPTSSSLSPPSHLPLKGDIRMANTSTRLDAKSEAKVVLAVVAPTISTSSGAAAGSLDITPLHGGRYERADGSLVRMWAQRAGIQVLDIDPTVVPAVPHLPVSHGQSSPEKRRQHAHGGGERRDYRDNKESGPEREAERRPSLVEKPIAMAIVNEQPVKVLRVLARGEKLDP